MKHSFISVALQNLVLSSGGLAMKARPANPENIPAAMVDLKTVEQLVSSTTSDASESKELLDQQEKQDDGLLSELAVTAALAVVESPDNSENTGGVHKVKVVPISLFSSVSSKAEINNAKKNAFFLNKNSGTTGIHSIQQCSKNILPTIVRPLAF